MLHLVTTTLLIITNLCFVLMYQCTYEVQELKNSGPIVSNSYTVKWRVSTVNNSPFKLNGVNSDENMVISTVDPYQLVSFLNDLQNGIIKDETNFKNLMQGLAINIRNLATTQERLAGMTQVVMESGISYTDMISSSDKFMMTFLPSALSAYTRKFISNIVNGLPVPNPSTTVLNLLVDKYDTKPAFLAGACEFNSFGDWRSTIHRYNIVVECATSIDKSTASIPLLDDLISAGICWKKVTRKSLLMPALCGNKYWKWSNRYRLQNPIDDSRGDGLISHQQLASNFAFHEETKLRIKDWESKIGDFFYFHEMFASTDNGLECENFIPVGSEKRQTMKFHDSGLYLGTLTFLFSSDYRVHKSNGAYVGESITEEWKFSDWCVSQNCNDCELRYDSNDDTWFDQNQRSTSNWISGFFGNSHDMINMFMTTINWPIEDHSTFERGLDDKGPYFSIKLFVNSFSISFGSTTCSSQRLIEEKFDDGLIPLNSCPRLLNRCVVNYGSNKFFVDDFKEEISFSMLPVAKLMGPEDCKSYSQLCVLDDHYSNIYNSPKLKDTNFYISKYELNKEEIQYKVVGGCSNITSLIYCNSTTCDSSVSNPDRILKMSGSYVCDVVSWASKEAVNIEIEMAVNKTSINVQQSIDGINSIISNIIDNTAQVKSDVDVLIERIKNLELHAGDVDFYNLTIISYAVSAMVDKKLSKYMKDEDFGTFFKKGLDDIANGVKSAEQAIVQPVIDAVKEALNAPKTFMEELIQALKTFGFILLFGFIIFVTMFASFKLLMWIVNTNDHKKNVDFVRRDTKAVKEIEMPKIKDELSSPTEKTKRNRFDTELKESIFGNDLDWHPSRFRSLMSKETFWKEYRRIWNLLPSDFSELDSVLKEYSKDKTDQEVRDAFAFQLKLIEMWFTKNNAGQTLKFHKEILFNCLYDNLLLKESLIVVLRYMQKHKLIKSGDELNHIVLMNSLEPSPDTSIMIRNPANSIFMKDEVMNHTNLAITAEITKEPTSDSAMLGHEMLTPPSSDDEYIVSLLKLAENEQEVEVGEIVKSWYPDFGAKLKFAINHKMGFQLVREPP